MNRYTVRNEIGMEVCTGILQMFFGNLWESAMDRLEQRVDGYIRSLHFHGQEYRVYRRRVGGPAAYGSPKGVPQPIATGIA